MTLRHQQFTTVSNKVGDQVIQLALANKQFHDFTSLWIVQMGLRIDIEILKFNEIENSAEIFCSDLVSK